MHREYRPPGTSFSSQCRVRTGTRPAVSVTRWTRSALIAATLLHAALLSAQPRSGAAPLGAPASPQGSDAGNQREQAAARFDRGIQLYRAGRYAEAFAKFLEARELYPSPAFSFNLGRCAERMKDTPSALRYYRDYLRESPYAEDFDAVTKRIRTLEQTLVSRGVQQVTVLSNPEGATVHVDDKPVGITPWTGELTPGAHTLKLVRSGYAPALEQLELSPERAVDVSVQLTQAQPKPTVAVPPRPARQLVPAPAAPHRPARSEAVHGPGATIHIWTWGVLGASAAALGGAGVYELFRRNAESEVSRHDTQLARLDEYQDMKHYQRDARILLGIGGGLALVGGGLLLWDLASTAHAPRADAERRAHGSSDVVSARVGCDGLVCGLFMHGRLP